jgi:4-amino-4-deoxy-L-arabinose transferase-like glycosyltransferase
MIRVKKIFLNQEWLILVALSLLVVLLRLPSLEHPFDNDSAANAYHARLIVRGEPLYGTHHPAHHLPAVYYTYALAFFLFGDSLWAVKFLLILWIIVTVYLLYRLGELVMNKGTGLLAAIFCAVLTAHLWMWGNSAEIEQFANLPRIAAFLVLMQLSLRYPVGTQAVSTWKFVFVGLLGAVAFLFKAVYFSPLALAGFVLLAELWRNRTKTGVWRATVLRGLWIGVGFMAGLLIVVAYFGALGLLPRLLLVFKLGQAYVDSSGEDPQYALLHPIVGLAYNNVALLSFSLAGLLIISINKNYRTTVAFYVVIWYVLSFLEAGSLVRVFRFYYYLLIVPPLALLAAWFLVEIYREVKNQRRVPNRFTAPLLVVTLLLVTLSISIAQNFNFYYHYVKYRLGQETHREFLLEGSPFGPQLVLLQDVADYIQVRTTPADRITYWSDNVQLYYLTNRLAPIDVIWLHYAEVSGPYQRIFTPQTKYFIVDPGRPRLDWVEPELAKHYELEAVIYDQEIYRRAD